MSYTDPWKPNPPVSPRLKVSHSGFDTAPTHTPPTVEKTNPSMSDGMAQGMKYQKPVRRPRAHPKAAATAEGIEEFGVSSINDEMIADGSEAMTGEEKHIAQSMLADEFGIESNVF